MMKKYSNFIIIFLLSTYISVGQNADLLKVETYQLDNGFTVMLNKDTTVAKVFGAVMVNAGAKHESPEATGMAHYLEHLLFKGTNVMGTTDFKKEKPHLDSIRNLYDAMTLAKDKGVKDKIQQQINEQALKASAYGLPNEFDKMLRSIGSTGINAFTNHEMTFYHNSFPGHEINRWLDIYAQRFQNPVFRSFQSELEVVYEEKNRATDDFQRMVMEEMQGLMFPNLPYGQWSVLGTREHLKNPSLNAMYAFFEKYYVPNNMALILCGSFDVDKTKALIKEKFGAWERGAEPEISMPDLEKIVGVQKVKKRLTPVKVGFLGFQTVEANHPDRVAMDLCEYLLYNEEETGFINKLELNNEMIYAGAFGNNYNDAGGTVFIYVPKILVQSLGNAEKKIFAAIDKLKEGEVSEAMLNAAKANMVKNFNDDLEGLTYRGILVGQAFNKGKSWDDYIKYPQQIKDVDIVDIQRVAKTYFGENYIRMISRTGFKKTPKLEKPPYKPVTTSQKGESEYFKKFEALPSGEFKPKYVDFEDGVSYKKTGEGHELWLTENPLNELFSLQIKYRLGKSTTPQLEVLSGLLGYAGADTMSLTQLKEAFAALGCSYNFSVDGNYFTLNLSGEESNIEACLALAHKLMYKPMLDESVRDLLINEVETNKKIEKNMPSVMAGAMLNYAVYAENSPFLHKPTVKEVKSFELAKAQQMLADIVNHYRITVDYCGKQKEQIEALLNTHYHWSDASKVKSLQMLTTRKVKENTIYIVHTGKAAQSHISFYIRGGKDDLQKYAQIEAFNQYFGGGFSGLVLQEIREYRSLAYSTSAKYVLPSVQDSAGFFYSYIGCQSDKSNDVVEVMHGLIKDMPLKPERMASLSQSLQLEVLTSYPSFRNISATVRGYKNQGYMQDPNIEAVDLYKNLEMENITSFWEENIKDKPMVITIYGNKKDLDIEALEAYGKVVELKIDDIVRY